MYNIDYRAVNASTPIEEAVKLMQIVYRI